MPARPLEAKMVLVEQNSRLTLGSPCNNVKKSFVRWDSYCVVCGPPEETAWPARALKKKGVKKVQPVWLQVEQQREPVWLLPTFVNSFWLNSFLNSFQNSFGMPCTIGSFSIFDALILMLLCLVPLYLFGHLCGGPPQVQQWCRCCATASEANPSFLCLYPVLGWGSDICVSGFDSWWRRAWFDSGVHPFGFGRWQTASGRVEGPLKKKRKMRRNHRFLAAVVEIEVPMPRDMMGKRGQ